MVCIKRADWSKNFGKISPHFSEWTGPKLALKIEKADSKKKSLWQVCFYGTSSCSRETFLVKQARIEQRRVFKMLNPFRPFCTNFQDYFLIFTHA